MTTPIHARCNGSCWYRQCECVCHDEAWVAEREEREAAELEGAP